MSKIKGIAIITMLVAFAACSKLAPHQITQADLDKIKSGMSEAGVKSILGEPTDKKTEPIPIVGGTKTTMEYDQKQDHVIIVLKNDTVQTIEGHFSPD